MTTDEFILAARGMNANDAALKARQYPQVDAAFAVQQIEGWQKAQQKLPEMAAIDGWIWPKRLSMEQCSSEETARYKSALYKGNREGQIGVDLTGGFGVDTYYLSEGFAKWHYVECQPELCQIAEHNFGLANRPFLSVHCTSSETFLEHLDRADLIYLDPARRNEQGGKVFRLEDCTPDLTTLYPELISRCKILMIKLSPMLDIQEAVRHMPHLRELHIVALRGEVKELLALCDAAHQGGGYRIHAVNLPDTEQTFVFRPDEEQAAIATPATSIEAGDYLYEPNAAILKSGAFRLISARYGLHKAAASTHLYLSSERIEHFPGRVFRIEKVLQKADMKALQGEKMNIVCRNYPLRPEEVKKKLKTRDGGDRFIIGLRLGDKPTLVTAERL